MRVGLYTICYNEQRFIGPFLDHIPEWVDEKIVLVSTLPWQGEPDEQDQTAEIARSKGATVVENAWIDEAEQRNTGMSMLVDCDWVIVMDPDELLSKKEWEKLRVFCEVATARAYVVEKQRVFYKNKEVYPCHDYQQIILVRPGVEFVEKRNVNCHYDVAPIELLHFSWARTNKEVWSKISHYSHANEMDIEGWYKNVWLAGKTEDLHPNTPEALKALIDAKLPPELDKLGLLP